MHRRDADGTAAGAESGRASDINCLQIFFLYYNDSNDLHF